MIEDLSFSLPKAGIVGIVGANGAGKSTLFNLLTGTEPVDSGKITIGPTVDLGYVDQSRESLDPSRSVYEEITGGVDNLIIGGKEVNGPRTQRRLISEDRTNKTCWRFIRW